MFRMDIQNVTNRLVDMFLVGDKMPFDNSASPEAGSQSLRDSAMHFFYDVSLRSGDNPNQKVYEMRTGLHLLYARPAALNNVDVFSAVTTIRFRRADEVTAWVHRGSHDSEWRHTKAFSELYFHMASEINAQREADFLPTIAPISMSEQGYTAFGLFNQVFRWVQVTVSQDPADQRRYRRLVKVL